MVNTEVHETYHEPQFGTHDTLVCNEETHLTMCESKICEENIICKDKETEIEVNLVTESIVTSNLRLTEANVNTNNTQTQAHESCVFVKENILKNAEKNSESKINHGDIQGDKKVQILPSIHNEKSHEDDTTLHTLADVACSRDKNNVFTSKKSTSVIHDKHNGDPKTVMSLLLYMQNILKIQKDTYTFNDVDDTPGGTYVLHEQSTRTVVSEQIMDTKYVIDSILKRMHHKDIVPNIMKNGVTDFSDLATLCCKLVHKQKKKKKYILERIE